MMRDIRSFGTRRIVPASALRKSRKQNKTKTATSILQLSQKKKNNKNNNNMLYRNEWGKTEPHRHTCGSSSSFIRVVLLKGYRTDWMYYTWNISKWCEPTRKRLPQPVRTFDFSFFLFFLAVANGAEKWPRWEIRKKIKKKKHLQRKGEASSNAKEIKKLLYLFKENERRYDIHRCSSSLA